MARMTRCLLILAAWLALPALACAQTVLRLDTLAVQGGPEAQALAVFRADVAAGTQGGLRIDLHMAAPDTNPALRLEALMAGQTDILAGDMGYFLPLMIDEVTGLGLPFLVPDTAATRRYLESQLFQDARQKLLDYRHIRFLETDAFRGAARGMATTRPVASLDALHGLRLAVFPSPSKGGVAVWAALGVTVLPVNWPDAAAALRAHRIDGVVAPDRAALAGAGLLRLAHFTGPVQDHPQLWPIAINDVAWQKLSPPQQQVLARAAAHAAAVFTQAAAWTDADAQIRIDALAAHDRLFSAYTQLLGQGALIPRVRDTAAASIARSGPGAGLFPVPPGQSFQDCPTCPVMMVVPAGHFLMGSPADEAGRYDNEGPQHDVVVSHPFAISRDPVTMGQLRAWQPGRGPDPVDNDPAVMLTWDETGAYAQFLTRSTGRRYHLPTEAEYEYAERAGTSTPYYWGTSIGTNNANCFGCGSAWDGKGSAPVGSFAANNFGLHDMTGNVFEWVQDCYVDSQAGAPADAFIAREASEGGCKSRVLRASSWFNLPSFLRSAYRFHEDPEAKSARRSFRLVIDD